MTGVEIMVGLGYFVGFCIGGYAIGVELRDWCDERKNRRG